jgi:hypothetical protein
MRSSFVFLGLGVAVLVSCGGQVIDRATATAGSSNGAGYAMTGGSGGTGVAGGSSESGGAVPTGSGGRQSAVDGGVTWGTGGYDPYGSTGGYDPYGSTGGSSLDTIRDATLPPCTVPNTAPIKPTGPNVWDGQDMHLNDTSNSGYWYSYYDGSSGLAVLPSNTSFGSGVVGGFIEASGFGTVTSWGGGVAVSFFNSMPLTPADLSPYKGIVFQFKNSADYGAHFAIHTWDFDPTFCTCQLSNSCLNNYGVDLLKGDGSAVVSYWICWPGITCTGPNPDASAEFPNPKQVTLISNVSGTVPFNPKRVTGIAFTSMDKSQWNFKVGTIRLFE